MQIPKLVAKVSGSADAKCRLASIARRPAPIRGSMVVALGSDSVIGADRSWRRSVSATRASDGDITEPRPRVPSANGFITVLHYYYEFLLV
eukprot:SAG11_NODE_5672_length_1490_cov_1.206326_1_plen_91_part_00